eukprot:6184566-Pleurochrysis_carterae.AAC.2
MSTTAALTEFVSKQHPRLVGTSLQPSRIKARAEDHRRLRPMSPAEARAAMAAALPLHARARRGRHGGSMSCG